MNPDDFHDLGLCPDCERDMTAGELHTADCPLAIAQDHEDGDHSGCDHGIRLSHPSPCRKDSTDKPVHRPTATTRAASNAKVKARKGAIL